MILRLLPVFLLACTSGGGGGGGDDTDSDGDGLTDAAEADLGTDPLAADTDGDGYVDGDELAQGTDPTDPASGIYAGGWPYNRDKDSIEDPGFSGRAREGEMFPRTTYVDQYGEEVDIYDYAGHGKYVVVDLSAEWCSYCQELAKEHEGRRNYFSGYWPDVQALVDSGEVYWVTVLAEDSNGRNSASQTAAAAGRWAEEFPNPAVAVTGDESYELTSWMNISGFPWLMLLDETMTIVSFDSRSNNLAPLDTLEEMVADGELTVPAE